MWKKKKLILAGTLCDCVATFRRKFCTECNSETFLQVRSAPSRLSKIAAISITMVSGFTPSLCQRHNVTGVTLAADWKRLHGGGGAGAVIKGQFILGGAPQGNL